MSKQATKDGPIPLEDRKCTDCLCLVIFLLVTVAMLGLGIYAWTNGNFKRLTTAYDPDGKGCGVDYPDYPYIYFASPHADSLWVTVCVSECPTANDKVLKCRKNSVVTSCQPVIGTNNTNSVSIYDTSVSANTVCLPTSNMLKGELGTALGGSTEMITSVMENYVLIILAFPIAILLSLIVILFIRLTASCFIYLLIFATIAALILFGVYLFIMPSLTGPGEEPLINDKTTRILVGIAVLLLAVLITIMVCCVRKRLSLASSIIKVSATFVTANCSIVFLPILLFVVMVLFVALWILEALGYYSLGTPTNAEHKYPFQHFDVPNWIVAVGIFHIFYLLWNLVFFIETGSFIIGGAATSWYYKKATPYADASARYRKKHIGSVALGSFFMALLGFLKFLYELVTPEQKEGDKGLLAAYKKCCDCVCCLCTKLFQWFNNGAFTVINLKGDSYCTAAGRAFTVRIQNIATSAVVDIVTSLFTLLVRIGITFLTIFVVYIITQYVPSFKESVKDVTLILLITGLVAFTISCFFISVYSDAMEAIYTTYLIELEEGGDSSNCPAELQEFLQEAQRDENLEK